MATLFYLDDHRRLRDRALFDPAIDSKLRGCDLVKLKIGDVVGAENIRVLTVRFQVMIDESRPSFSFPADVHTRLQSSRSRYNQWMFIAAIGPG